MSDDTPLRLKRIVKNDLFWFTLSLLAFIGSLTLIFGFIISVAPDPSILSEDYGWTTRSYVAASLNLLIATGLSIISFKLMRQLYSNGSEPGDILEKYSDQ